MVSPCRALCPDHMCLVWDSFPAGDWAGGEERATQLTFAQRGWQFGLRVRCWCCGLFLLSEALGKAQGGLGLSSAAAFPGFDPSVCECGEQSSTPLALPLSSLWGNNGTGRASILSQNAWQEGADVTPTWLEGPPGKMCVCVCTRVWIVSYMSMCVSVCILVCPGFYLCFSLDMV